LCQCWTRLRDQAAITRDYGPRQALCAAMQHLTCLQKQIRKLDLAMQTNLFPDPNVFQGLEEITVRSAVINIWCKPILDDAAKLLAICTWYTAQDPKDRHRFKVTQTCFELNPDRHRYAHVWSEHLLRSVLSCRPQRHVRLVVSHSFRVYGNRGVGSSWAALPRSHCGPGHKS
jgi:hypothetical protein